MENGEHHQHEKIFKYSLILFVVILITNSIYVAGHPFLGFLALFIGLGFLTVCRVFRYRFGENKRPWQGQKKAYLTDSLISPRPYPPFRFLEETFLSLSAPRIPRRSAEDKTKGLFILPRHASTANDGRSGGNRG